MTIPVVTRTSIGGVTVLRSDAAFGRYSAGLVFRVGRFDETLPDAGITHLVEHLVLRDHHKAPYHFNAQVTGLFTTFVMDSADPADVTAHLSAVCRGLVADHRAALEQEKRILRTEAASRGGAGALGTCLGERFGAAGPGLAGYQELGLQRADWAQVENWRRRWFTASNAVLWVNGPIPPGLRIDLPADPAGGLAPATAAPRPLDLTFPGYVITGRGSVGLSLVARRSIATSVTLDILEQRLTQTLRHERGLSYGVTGDTQWLHAGQLHGWLQADALPEQTSATAHTMLTTFEALAEQGGTREEVADYARRLREAYESPGGASFALHRQAQHILAGSQQPARQPEQTLRAIADLAGQSAGRAAGQSAGRAAGQADRTIEQAASELLASAIVAVPDYVPAVAGRMPPLPRWSAAADTIAGLAVGSLGFGLTLTVGYDGIMLAQEGKPEDHVTIRYGNVAAMLRWNDKKRALVGTDGFSIRLDPALWPDGEALVASIETRIPVSLRVGIDSPGPATPKPKPKPEQDSKPHPEPQGAKKGSKSGPKAVKAEPREQPAARRRRRTARIMQGLWIFIAVLGVLVAVSGDAGFGGVAAAVGIGSFLRWNPRTRGWAVRQAQKFRRPRPGAGSG